MRERHISFEERGLEIASECLQRLLDLQTPWGEWGSSGKQQDARVRRVERERMLLQLDKFAKPNVFITLLAMETLATISSGRFRQRIENGLGWIQRQISESDGWFLCWAEAATSPAPEVPYKEVRKVPDVRHTAQAAASIIRFRSMTYTSVTALAKVLEAQNPDGGWSDDLASHESRLFSTMYAAELLYLCSATEASAGLCALGRNDLLPRIRLGLERARGWLLEHCRDRGLWRGVYHTAIVLDRIGPSLYRDSPDLVRGAVTSMLSAHDGGTWIDGSTLDSGLREASRFPVTVRVISACQLLADAGCQCEAQSILPTAWQYVIQNFRGDALDEPDCCYLLKSLFRTRGIMDRLKSLQIHDYLSDTATAITFQRDQLKNILALRVASSAGRLHKLEAGMKAGVAYYADAFSEEKERLSLLLTAYGRATNVDALGQLSLTLRSARDLDVIRSSPTVRPARTRIRRPEDSPKLGFARAAAHSLYSEFLPRLIAELLKR